jgi:hypothetical protein
MPNIFDQFDEPAKARTKNVFDQFDEAAPGVTRGSIAESLMMGDPPIGPAGPGMLGAAAAGAALGATAPFWGPPVAAGALTAGRTIAPYAASAAAGAAGSIAAQKGAPDWVVQLLKDIALGKVLSATEGKK